MIGKRELWSIRCSFCHRLVIESEEHDGILSLVASIQRRAEFVFHPNFEHKLALECTTCKTTRELRAEMRANKAAQEAVA